MKTLIRQLDRTTTKILYLKERGKCFHCGMRATDTAHILGRRFQSTRWDTKSDGNVHLLCRKCHTQAHSRPHAYEEWFARYEGGGALQTLRRRSQQVSVRFESELRELLQCMKEEYEELRRTNNE